MFESFIEYFNSSTDFLNSGIYDFFTELLAQFVEYYAISVIQAKIFFMQIGWGVASNLLQNLGLSASIDRAWGNLDYDLLSYLTFFRIPEALNILLQASVTRFILRLF